ncbi:TetR family transcriptional regulator [Micromonospora sp. NPDC047548]|uniref:TetR family transcriptional regulator n=1 Tax=Micromonospora sp. NPDC047548 TaxID=3155624 RepID=UPI0033D4E3C3
MTGLRERRKEQTRQRIIAVATRLFTERGFDAVTVNEIAEAAEVAKATLFAYFPSKESLALQGVGEDDLAGVVLRRAPGQSPLQALRAHFRALADGQLATLDRDELVARMRVIFDSPALSGAANALLYQQRRALAEALTEEYGEPVAALMAAQIAATLLTLQESFFHHLAGDAAPEEAARVLAGETELAFDLLENGHQHRLHHRKGQ